MPETNLGDAGILPMVIEESLRKEFLLVFKVDSENWLFFLFVGEWFEST